MFFTEVISMFARFQARGAFLAAVKFDFAFTTNRCMCMKKGRRFPIM